MGPHGHPRDEEPRHDLLRRGTVPHELEHLPLSIGQLDAASVAEGDPAPAAAFAKLLDQQRHELARQRPLPLQDALQGQRAIASARCPSKRYPEAPARRASEKWAGGSSCVQAVERPFPGVGRLRGLKQLQCVGPALDAEFLDDCADVATHRHLRDPESIGDLTC